MKKLKENKGITLVALIITIIVLLILAVVAISEVNGEGIISKAKLARTNYQTAQETENSALSNYMTELNNANYNGNNNDNKDSKSLVNMYKKGEIQIGDYIAYTPDPEHDEYGISSDLDGINHGAEDYDCYDGYISQENLNWRVFGLDLTGNNLLLISDKPTDNKIMLEGITSCLHAEEILNETSSYLYGYESKGITARSVKNDDIEKLSEEASKKYTYWVAHHPDTSGDTYLVGCVCNGGLGYATMHDSYDYYRYTESFRPIVSIPSNITTDDFAIENPV